MVAVLGTRSAAEPLVDLGVYLGVGSAWTLPPQTHAEHGLAHLVELQGGAEPIGELPCGHAQMLLP